jgi:hypothetical protein
VQRHVSIRSSTQRYLTLFSHQMTCGGKLERGISQEPITRSRRYPALVVFLSTYQVLQESAVRENSNKILTFDEWTSAEGFGINCLGTVY